MDISTEILSYLLSILIQEGFYIVLACLFVGYVVKHQFAFIKNDYIPLITAVVGGILAALFPETFPNDSLILAIAKGIALGWASTGMYEVIKNLILNRINSEG